VFRTLLKTVIQLAYLLTIAPLRRLLCLGGQPVLVLAYHRVNDQLKDNITVGVKQFEDQIAVLAKYYTVVPLSALISAKAKPSIFRPQVVVTFDDGYLDNYTNAVPILLRYNISATFFVSTGMINTRKPFPHDLLALGYSPPTMTWDNLREMKDQGFTIGSHTVNHISCGMESRSVVERELQESRQTLREQLGEFETAFAFPYGSRTDCPEDLRDLIKQVGYVGCLSAYGNSNEAVPDPYDIKRVAVDYRFSLLGFIAQVEGYRIGWWSALPTLFKLASSDRKIKKLNTESLLRQIPNLNIVISLLCIVFTLGLYVPDKSGGKK